MPATATSFLLEIRQPGRPVRQLPVDRALEVGRECDGIVIADEGASRRHLKLLPSPLGLSVVDLNSRNGTLLNGLPLLKRTTLQHGDIIRLGHTELVVLSPPNGRATSAPPDPRSRPAPWTLPAPPAAPAVVRRPSVVGRGLRNLFTGAVPAQGPLFRTYLELPRRIPLRVWHIVRAASITAYVLLVVVLFVRPTAGLFVFFSIIVPLLPVLFFVAPGLWRNICPLAASNQVPRLFGFTKGRTPPGWLRRRSFVVAMTLFFVIAAARLALFNNSGPATGILLGVTILNAFAAGIVFKGKSGWCSSICPLLPLQRTYGQTPFVLVPNSHCTPCVACTKNCYDFKPQPAYQSDLHDADPQWGAPRKLFVGMLPGFVLGFFQLVGRPGPASVHTYALLGIYVAVSAALFFALDAVVPVSIALRAAVFAAAALNLFYWYAGAVLTRTVHTLTGLTLPWLPWAISAVIALLSVVWISRTYWTERRYLHDAASAPTLLPLTVATPAAPVAPQPAAAESGAPEVRLLPDDQVMAGEVGLSLLEVAERAGLPLEAGCRMGVCGADPVAVLGGMDCLSEVDEEERTTLRRLGLGATTRMACCARLKGGGAVQMNLTPEPGPAAGAARPDSYDRSITSVVVLGNGIAGVSAADFVRREHPDCEVHLVGMEPHVLYNRMGISRLVWGRSAMNGLYLLKDDWYAGKAVTPWLNTIATEIDLDAHRVALGTGETLVYDRLILATGSSSTRPAVEGFGAPGSFVLRSAEDAMDIRRYAQQVRARQAVVAGGGLLGLEAAHALNELGLRVTVLERGARLLSKQVDQRASDLLHAHITRLGIDVRYRAEAQTVVSAGAADSGNDESVTSVVLTDGTSLPGQVFLACVGIRPNAELAAQAGLVVRRGIVVDDHMRTSAPDVFAAGDVAEFAGAVLGLWPVAAKQGEVAAVNALGGDERLTPEVPPTVLKGVDLELSSIGEVQPAEGDEILVDDDIHYGTYKRLILRQGVVVGGLVVGHLPEELAAITTAVKRKRELDPVTLDRLRAGDWAVLLAPAPTARPLVGAFR